MSVQEKLNNIIPQTEKEFGNKNYVAVLGYSQVGKTVLITLLCNALDDHFLDKHPDIVARITSGDVHVKKWENGMIEGKFPKRTEILEQEEIAINMRGSGATGSTSVDIRFPDISGEDFRNLCIGDDVRGACKSIQSIRYGKTEGKDLRR